MRILRFKANNLFSLGDVEIDLDKRGLVLITGHSQDEGGANGSGKSSLSNKGILWTLFGSTASGERADAAINKFAPEDSTCCGLLDVESNRGDQFRIVRSRNPNRLSIADLATGVDLSAKTEKETQVLINTALGRTRETFLQTDFFGQGKQSAFLDLTPKAQVEVLETILPFDRLAQLCDKSKEYLNKLAFVHSSIERKVNEQTGKMLEAQRQERVLSDSIDTWETEHDQKILEFNQKIEELEDDGGAAKIEALKARAVELPNRDQIATAQDELQSYTIDLNGIEDSAKFSLSSWQRKLAKLVPVAKPTGNEGGFLCPTCLSDLPHLTYQHIQKRYEDYMHEYLECMYNITADEQTLLDVRNGRTEASEKQREILQATQDLANFEAELASLEAKRNNGELAILRQNLETTLSEVNPYTALYQQTSATVNMTTQNLSMQKTRAAEVEKDKGALTFWRDAFGKELKNEFISQVCPFLEKRANEHLANLGNPQLRMSVSTRKLLKSDENRSEFSIYTSSITGGGSYESLSGGERQLCSFAMGLSLADLAELQTDGPSYFMVLDEPFMALDSRNSENLVNYLNNYLQGKKETILLVSNEETLKSLIPNRINVIKENGISRIE